MSVLFLSAHPPFQFRSVIRSHGWYQLAPFEWDDARGVFRTVERLENGRVVVLEITGQPEGVAVTARPKLIKREEKDVAAKVTWMFGLDADFSAFYALADAEPCLAHCREKAYGRLLRSSSLFDEVVQVMMTTNILGGGTKRLVAALVDHFGEPLPGDGTRRAFPAAGRIARSRESTLRKLGLGYRAPYLLKLARGAASGQYDLEALKDQARSTEEVRRDLLALPGIGPYAAATLLGIQGRYDYIGVDTEAMSAVSQGFYGGKPIGEKEVDAAFARWGQYKALAYWFWDFSGQQQSPMEAWEAKQV
jgi:3-methyladenine DNA glycosylase/8-oxoguanine DNA glycosylase